MKKISIRAFTVCIIVLLNSILSYTQPVLDNTFASKGYKLTKIEPAREDIGRTVITQPNGRILTGGNSFNMIGYSDIAIVRMKPNGSYDNTFGVGGIATIPGGFFCDMALLPNGKIIVAGSGVGATNVNNYIVYRLNKNGTIDNTFGTGGSVHIDIPYTGMICYDVAIQPDNKIVLAGYAGGSGGYGNMLVVRLKQNGALDNSFATGGKFILYLSGKHSECRQIALQPDGKIVGSGYIDTLMFYAFFRYDFGAIRLNTNGTLDNSFGTDGVVRADKGTTDISNSIGLLSDGRIVLGGSSNYYVNNRFTALCLLSNGSPDLSFGDNGWTFLDFYGGSAGCQAIAIEPDDDIVMGGNNFLWIDGINTTSVALAKISSFGSPDITFGDGGIDTSMLGTISIGCNDVVLQPDGKIVIGGYSYAGTYSAFLTARYTNTVFMMKESQPVASDQMMIYPNPLIGQQLNIDYTIETSAEIQIKIIDMSGNIVLIETPGYLYPGLYHTVISLPINIPSGLYLVEINKGNTSTIQKLQIVK